jgi:hypothetical protein
MKTMLRSLLLGLLLLWPSLTQAQLMLLLSHANQAGTAGSTLAFSGRLSNLGTSPLFLNGDTFTLEGSGLTLDDTPFFDNAPLSLDAGATYLGPLFDVQIASDAPGQTASGSFTILGGPEDTSQINLATAQFGVSVVPEPGALAFLVGTLVLAVGFRRTRKR